MGWRGSEGVGRASELVESTSVEAGWSPKNVGRASQKAGKTEKLNWMGHKGN